MDSAKEEVKKNNMGLEDYGHLGYDLRENPKKSWKFSGSKDGASISMQEFQCQVCGKDFESPKALYGHMRHHSGRERKRKERNFHCKECGKAYLSSKSLANHTRVHSQKSRVCDESGTSSMHDVEVKSLCVKRKRSKRKRYNFNASSSVSSLNESFSVTEIDQEVEQVAVCLMMLSRGVQNWGEFYSFTEFSNNDSLTFEVKSLDQKKQIVTNEGAYFVVNGNDSFKMKKPRKEMLKSCVSESLIVLYEKEEEDEGIELDSGIESDKGNKVKLEVSIERFYQAGEFKIPNLDYKSESLPSDIEIEKEMPDAMKLKSNDVESSEDLMEAGLGITTSTWSKKFNLHDCDAEFGVDSSSKEIFCASDHGISNDSQKKHEIKCKTCNRIFFSRQALGGHQRMHSNKRKFMPLKTENCEEQSQDSTFTEVEAGGKLECSEYFTEIDTSGAASFGDYESRESKKHKCHICLKVFATGQALGGHKRSHIAKNSDTIPHQIAINQEYSDVLDLSIPVMVEEKPNSEAGSNQWWVGSDHRHEPLVSLVAN